MKQVKYFFILAFLVLAAAAVFSSTKKPDDATWYASIWDYAAKNRDAESLPAIFKAIEIKHQTEFAPAILKYLELNQSNAAQAIYTLNKLGVPNTEGFFNRLLSQVPDYQTAAWISVVEEKKIALDYMLELGLKPDQKASDQLKKDFTSIINAKDPKRVLSLAASAKSFGIELDVQQKVMLTSLCTEKWRKDDPFDLKKCGIHPDWIAILEKEKESWFRGEAVKALLIAGNKEEYAKYLDWYNKTSEVNSHKPQEIYGELMKASMGDQSAIDYVLKNANNETRPLINSMSDKLPSSLIIKGLEMPAIFFSFHPQETRFLGNLEKLGYKAEVQKHVNQIEEKIKSLTSDVDADTFSEIQNEVREIAIYDGSKYMDLFWIMHQKLPENIDVARTLMITNRLNRYLYYGQDNQIYTWIEKNPEKFAEVVKLLIEKKTTESLPQEGDLESMYSYNRNMAFQAMALLPAEVFKANFEKLNSKYFTKSAYLTGNYFKAKWAYRKDQAEFYKKYGPPERKRENPH